MSGVESRLDFQIQNQINFCFQSLGENKREEAEKSQVKIKDLTGFFLGSWQQVTVCIFKDDTNKNIIILPSFSICIFLPLYFQRTVGGGELSTSQIMSALSPSVNS